MRNLAGKLIGFVIGAAGFLWLFKIFFIANVPPSDELAPGVVMIVAIVSGCLFALIGSKIQGYFRKKAR